MHDMNLARRRLAELDVDWRGPLFKLVNWPYGSCLTAALGAVWSVWFAHFLREKKRSLPLVLHVPHSWPRYAGYYFSQVINGHFRYNRLSAKAKPPLSFFSGVFFFHFIFFRLPCVTRSSRKLTTYCVFFLAWCAYEVRNSPKCRCDFSRFFPRLFFFACQLVYVWLESRALSV